MDLTITSVADNLFNSNGDIELTPLPDDSVASLAWSPGGDLLATGSWDKKIRIYEISTDSGSPIATAKTMVEHQGPVLHVSFTRDGRLLSGGCDKEAVSWDLFKGQKVPFGRHEAPIKYVKWSEKLNVAITAGWDNKIKFWDPRNKPGQEVGVVDLGEKIYSVDLNEETDLMVVGCANRKIHLFNPFSSNPLKPSSSVFSPLKFQTRCVVALPKVPGFAVGGVDGRIAIRPNTTNSSTYDINFKSHRHDKTIYPVNAMDFHPLYTNTLASVGGDGTLCFWETENNMLLKQLPSNNLPITCCKFNPTGSVIAYSPSYDWSSGIKGYETDRTKGSHILLRTVQPDELTTGQNHFGGGGGGKKSKKNFQQQGGGQQHYIPQGFPKGFQG